MELIDLRPYQTHNVALIRKLADFTVTLDINGRVIGSGPISESPVDDLVLEDELQEELEERRNQAVDLTSTTAKDPPVSGGKLIMAEEVQVGHMGWKVCKSCFSVFLHAFKDFGLTSR